MLGKIIAIEDNTVAIQLNIDLTKFQSLLNLHVVMQEPLRTIIGEITDIRDNVAYVNLLGEFIKNEFVYGVIKKPSFAATVKLVSKDRLPSIVSIDKYDDTRDLYIGESPIYDGMKIGMNINSFFSNHFAIFGNTGSGKSCGIARIIQNLFHKENPPYRANLFIFDAYGEYHTAFKDLTNISEDINFKTYTTNLEFSESEILRIPLWLLGVDDISLLLGVEKATQLPIVEKALKLVTVFAKEGEENEKIKNDIIARVLIEVLSSGKPAAQMRDQVVSILSSYETSKLNLNTEVYQPGYSRQLKQCLTIDDSGRLRDIDLITDFLETFLLAQYELVLPDGSFPYTIDQLAEAFDFALISEGSLTNNSVFEEMNVLRARVHNLANSDDRKYFEYPEYINRRAYINELITAHNGKKAQIINFNINYVDDRLAKNITKIYSKMLFDFSKDHKDGAKIPFHIILEEAHRYVQNDMDADIFGYNIFERITKEGRKYGILLGLISQRPSELSDTVISQCTNFLIFKMIHPKDVDYIKEMVPNVTPEIVKNFKLLQPGNCIAFGNAFKVPILVRMQMPDPAPNSSSCDISGIWFMPDKKEKVGNQDLGTLE